MSTSTSKFEFFPPPFFMVCLSRDISSPPPDANRDAMNPGGTLEKTAKSAFHHVCSPSLSHSVFIALFFFFLCFVMHLGMTKRVHKIRSRIRVASPMDTLDTFTPPVGYVNAIRILSNARPVSVSLATIFPSERVTSPFDPVASSVASIGSFAGPQAPTRLTL